MTKIRGIVKILILINEVAPSTIPRLRDDPVFREDAAPTAKEKQRSKRRGEKRQRSKKIRKQRNSGKEKVGVQENCIIFDTDEQYGK